MYHATFRPYRRLFSPPLQTHHGAWPVREGMVVRLIDASPTVMLPNSPAGTRGDSPRETLRDRARVGWGEIAPIPWFGSESFPQAWAFCQQLPPLLPDIPDLAIPSELTACQFGLETAWLALVDPGPPLPPEADRPSALCGLLATGAAALTQWPTVYHQGYRTLKWKIGVAAIAQEIALFQELLTQLPAEITLRLDANGGLTRDEAVAWLKVCDRVPDRVEFLEQPLPPTQLAEMITLSQQFATPLALDESVATLAQLEDCYQHGWRGIYVIKPAIAGSPRALQHRCQDYGLDTVFSSVFETAIARHAALRLAYQLSPAPRRPGFGTGHWFDGTDRLQAGEAEQIWGALAR